MFLGIDVGTQSVKVLVYDAESRRVLAQRSSPLAMISDAHGTREQMPQWWITALQDCMARLDPVDLRAIKAIGVSGQQHGLVCLDAQGDVLAPAKLWCDTTTSLECDEIAQVMGGQGGCIEAAGNAILPGYTAAKIRWLMKNKPDAYAALATILLPHDYINFYLTGEYAMECGDASGTALLDIRSRNWHADLLKAVDAERDLGNTLPALREADEVIGSLRADVAQTLGLSAGVAVTVGGGDNMMAAIGTSNASTGRLTVSLGTSGTLFANSDRPVVDPGGQVASFCSSTGSWLPLVCTMNCTVATELTRALFDRSLVALDETISAVPAGANGVVTVPFFNGERTPNLPAGKGCIFGLDSTNYSADNLLRASMEAAVYGLRQGLDALTDLGCSADAVRLTGGGAGSAAWRQMIADVFDRPVTVQTVDEGAALGAALQAMWVYSGTPALQPLLDEHLQVDAARSCTPRSDQVAVYREHYDNYQRHVTAVTDLYR